MVPGLSDRLHKLLAKAWNCKIFPIIACEMTGANKQPMSKFDTALDVRVAYGGAIMHAQLRDRNSRSEADLV